jgi:hypothetical protein
VAILENYGIVPSMSRPANPYDNASCESFMKTLKREEIYANRYDNLEHMRANIEEFIEQYYNRQRLHSALGYRSPEEFEQQSELRNSAASPGATVQFVVNDENSENTGLSGEEDSNAVLFPRPLFLLGDTTKPPKNSTQKVSRKGGRVKSCRVCPIFCLTTGVHAKRLGTSPGTNWEQNTQEQHENSTINIHVNHREAKTGIDFIRLITRRSSVQI